MLPAFCRAVPPSVLPDISPSRGEIGMRYRVAHPEAGTFNLRLLREGRWPNGNLPP